MKRNLLILRHAKSDWADASLDDFDRPLARRGLKALRRMDRWISDQRLGADLMVSSPALRARQTALALCGAFGLQPDGIHWEPDIYEASLQTLLAVLARVPAGIDSAVVVGHNPGLEELVRYLAGSGLAGFEAPKLMPTAALAQLELPSSWQGLAPGAGRLLSLDRPRNLGSG